MSIHVNTKLLMKITSSKVKRIYYQYQYKYGARNIIQLK